VITDDGFEMIETLSREALARHPVWAHFRDPDDRETILGWGVGADALEAQIARYRSCGLQPLYPVLRCDPLPAIPHLVVAVRFDCADGTQLPGYVIAPHAFGIYVGEREFTFNRNLATLSRRVAASLGAALGRDAERLFPLRPVPQLPGVDDARVAGEIPRFW